ncbi:cytochrome P450 [Xylariaceae sp. FL0255]|nr:cytochrome P450 [Xylariaceae sp. FL0255]
MGYSAILWIAAYAIIAFLTAIFVNLLHQQLPRSKTEPPLVFHWIPFVGSAIPYGTDPCRFYMRCREKYGDVFIFVLFGRKITVFLGIKGNRFILDGRLEDLNAEEIYSPLTTPVFGPNIVYDCPNSKFMEQKKFVRFGLSQDALESYVKLIEKEVLDYIHTSPAFQGKFGTVDISTVMSEITIYTASRSLQGAEVRRKMSAEFAKLYHDMDHGFQPINFLMPWAPLPQNRRRDKARAKMHSLYREIITERRRQGKRGESEPDMIWNLMDCAYKNGTALSDREIADMMITLLMAGQHSSASTGAWTILRLASQPHIAEKLYEERLGACGDRQLEFIDTEKLSLAQNVVKETLRVHSSIHSIMRKVKNPMPVPDSNYIITPDKVLLASPIVTHLSEEYFPNATTWDPMRWEKDSQQDNTDDIVDYGYGAISKATNSPYLPFGAGRHRCIGEKFAYVNLVTIISTLVQHFRFCTVDGKESVPPTDYTSLFSRPTRPALVLWERRLPQKLGSQ